MDPRGYKNIIGGHHHRWSDSDVVGALFKQLGQLRAGHCVLQKDTQTEMAKARFEPATCRL